jgi:tyrosyl-tRNA synthetase
VGLTEAPEQMYGLVMSVPDAALPSWIRLLAPAAAGLAAQADALEAGAGEPMAAKQALAAALVERFHDADAARRAALHFRRVVQERQLPGELPVVTLALAGEPSAGLLDAMRTAFSLSSNAEARRLIAQGAVEVDGRRVSDPTFRLASGAYVVRAGRRRAARIEVTG